VDVAQKAIQIARQRVPGAELARCDASSQDLPFRGRFDLVTCSEVLEHVSDYYAVLRRMARLLRPGGYLAISVPHSMKKWTRHDDAVLHLRRFEREGLREALTAQGLQVCRCFTWGSLFYELYYGLLLSNVKPATTWKPKSRAMQAAHSLLYAVLFLDDMCINIGTGRMLFALARKPVPGL
jgi:trans-aconitate methyltransferase